MDAYLTHTQVKILDILQEPDAYLSLNRFSETVVLMAGGQRIQVVYRKTLEKLIGMRLVVEGGSDRFCQRFVLNQ